MARANRAERRRRGGPSPARGRALVQILPGLPGGGAYIPDEELFAEAERHFDAVAAMHPGMVQRRLHVRAWGISPVRRRLRHELEALPGGGLGVVVDKFTERPAVDMLELPERKWPSGLILLGGESGVLQRPDEVRPEPISAAEAARRFLEEHR